MSEEYKQQVYKRWIERGRPWFDLDPSKEPTYAERQIILEMKKRENTRVKSNIELEKRTAEIKQKYRGKIPDSILSRKIFELDNY